MPCRESFLAAVLATTTLFPNFAQADQPQPSLFHDSTAAQARPIRQATEPADAQWAEVRKRHIGSSSTTLRWQVPPVGAQPQPAPQSQVTPLVQAAARERQALQVQAVSHVEPVTERPKQIASKVIVWGQDDGRPQGSQVRLVTQLGPIDPFDDPFGDRAPQFDEPRGRTYTSQPANSQPGAPTRPSVAPEPMPPQSEPEFSPFRDDPPEPAPLNDLDLQPAPLPGDTLPPPPGSNEREFRDPVIPRARPSYQPASDCDKVYNERDCCTDAEQCQNARRRVRENTIDKISVNISPSFKPDAATKAEAEQARTLRLAQSAIRSWRNRDGKIVARGQVTDLQFGRVHIEDDGKVEKISVGELSDDDWCFLAAWWGVPTECSLGDDKFEYREWLASTMTWKASGLCHKPLYFEDVQLERYGHTAGPLLQPVLSGAHFFGSAVTVPYQMGMSPPTECEYALGYYRPGSCAPWLLPPVPLSVRGALLEAGAITGGVFVIP